MPHSKEPLKIALAGNPNSGKTSLFNELTGLNQKVGNYPGITVDKKTGQFNLTKDGNIIRTEVTDLPGAYSLKPRSEDEEITKQAITDKSHPAYPDAVIFVADTTNLKRSLYFCTQLIDLGLPIVLALNMMDKAEKTGLQLDDISLENELGIPVVRIVARKGKGMNGLKEALAKVESPKKHFFTANGNPSQEILARYDRIESLLTKCVIKTSKPLDPLSNKLDMVLTHKIWGFVIFGAILAIIFQFIFSWAEYPMILIDEGFAQLGSWLNQHLPEHFLSSLLIDGVLAGLAGILIFIPQIAFLFFFIAILEDTGYMARVSLIMDKVMRNFGLSGRSVVPMASGMACAVPAIMSARSISNWKERMITIMVTPLMTCSARLPIYVLLIALVIPDEPVFGILNLQGLTLFAMYFLGILSATATALVMKLILHSNERSVFLMEMPAYSSPRWKNVGLTIFEKVKVFVVEAGRVIIVVSIILWALASYGPGDAFDRIEQKYADHEPTEEIASLIASKKLEASYAGVFGKTIEPVIEPLGFDWKIGIALLTSFAAREVFVGTLATIYSVGDKGDTKTIKEHMLEDVRPETGEKLYTVAVGLSLMIFYAFAMQCMSTLAVVFRETKKLKWPVIQFTYMTILAYLSSLLVYQLLK